MNDRDEFDSLIDEQARLNGLLAEVRAERDALATRNSEIGQELAELRDEIKELRRELRHSGAP